MGTFFSFQGPKGETHIFSIRKNSNALDFSETVFFTMGCGRQFSIAAREIFLCRCSVGESNKGFRLYRPALFLSPLLVIIGIFGNIG